MITAEEKIMIDGIATTLSLLLDREDLPLWKVTKLIDALPYSAEVLAEIQNLTEKESVVVQLEQRGG